MMPMPAYRPTVANRNQYPIHWRDSPICSAMASSDQKADETAAYTRCNTSAAGS